MTVYVPELDILGATTKEDIMKAIHRRLYSRVQIAYEEWRALETEYLQLTRLIEEAASED